MFNQHLLEGIVQVANTDEQGRLYLEGMKDGENKMSLIKCAHLVVYPASLFLKLDLSLLN